MRRWELGVSWVGYPAPRLARCDNSYMTYFRIEFLTVCDQPRRPKRFRTEEQARRYAKRILGITDESPLASKAIAVPVNRTAPAQ